MSPAEPLDAAQLQAALRGSTLGREVVVLAETTSTNDHLFASVTAMTPEGLVVFAEKQTAGRGQYGRHWESAPRLGLWFSVLLRPRISPDATPRLTSWAAQAIARALAPEATVKPPNDVYLDGRKVAGVLLEMRAVPGQPHLGILGIGINVLQQADDFPAELRDRAASLAMLRPEAKISRQDVAVQVLRELDRTYRAALNF